MYLLDEQPPTETIHLYVVPENEIPPKRDYPALIVASLCIMLILGIVALSSVSATPVMRVAFTLALQGYRLASVSQSAHITAIATGKRHIPATQAHGRITFYNGAIYTQIIPVGTILKGADGISVVTDAQAVIPPAAQTTPPTYGQVTVLAHALVAGIAGNIPAGDINEACCVTSVIAQNPYSFTGGKSARDITYITQQDITRAIAPLQPMLHQQTLALFPMAPILDAICSAQTQTKGVHVTIIETCRAFSYDSRALQKKLIEQAIRQFGRGNLSHVQIAVIDVTKQGLIQFYVSGIWTPQMMRHYWEGK